MKQFFQLCLLKLLLFSLAPEPSICRPHNQFNKRQKAHFGTALYFKENLGNPIKENPRNLKYQPYQPQYEIYDVNDDGLLQKSQHVQERAAKIPYQTINKPNEQNLDIEDRIRSIFHVGTDQGTQLINTFLQNPKFNTVEFMQSDDSSKIKNTDYKESRTALSSSTTTPTMINTEPTSKIQGTPKENLSVVFTNTSLQQPIVGQQIDQSPNVTKRPDINFTKFNGCSTYQRQSLCEKAHNYPNLVHLDNILKREFSKLGLIFAEDLELPKNVSQRFGGNTENIDPCDCEDKVIFPEAGVTKNSTWMLIVNNKRTYRQGVRVEECRSKDRPCNIINQNLPNHYKSICVQHYIYRQLYAITENGHVVQEYFKIPSACKCMLRNTTKF